MSREIADQEAEAEQLDALARAHAPELAAARLGGSFRLGEAAFRLHARGRNTIYRVRGRSDWFLKFAPPSDTDVMPREQLGTDVCRRVLGGRPDYGGPFVTRVSLRPPYILATAIAGAPLTSVLARDVWTPWLSGRLEAAFATLGTLLGTLHSNTSLPDDAPEATKRPFDVVRKLAGRINAPDATIRQVRSWCADLQDRAEADTFIHGNLRLDNLLFTNGRIGFVDFEHSGRGPRYQDASRPVTQLLLVRASVASPTRRVDRVLRAFLKAYGAVRPYDRSALGDWVAVRLARYYLESHARRVPAFIGGLPVVRARLGGLARDLMQGGLGAKLDPES